MAKSGVQITLGNHRVRSFDDDMQWQKITTCVCLDMNMVMTIPTAKPNLSIICATIILLFSLSPYSYVYSFVGASIGHYDYESHIPH